MNFIIDCKTIPLFERKIKQVLSKTKILCVVPARGGSKGVPNKNIRELGGKSLIAHSIEVAKDAGEIIDKIVVSTDSEKIARIAMSYGAEVPFLRSSELASDKAHTIDAVLDVLERLKKNESYTPDWVLLLQPTSPFRDKSDIEQIVKIANLTNCSSVIGVKHLSDSDLKKVMSIKDSYLTPAFEKNFPDRFRRQDGQVDYFSINGSIYLTKVEALRKRSFYGERSVPYIMPNFKCVDIDTEEDFAIAELLYKALPILRGMTNVQK